MLKKELDKSIESNLVKDEEQALAQLKFSKTEEKNPLTELEELKEIKDPVTAFRRLSSVVSDLTFEKLDPDLFTQIKVAIRDVIAQKAFSVENFETLQLVILNIQEVLSHPLLKDELKEFCKAALTQLIEKLAREELSAKALQFLDRNLEVLHPEITREVLPEILNPFLISVPKEQKDMVQKLVDRLCFVLSYLIDSEQAIAEDLKSKKAEARATLNEIKAVLTQSSFSKEINTSYYFYIMVFISLGVLLIFFLLNQ